MVRYNGLNHSDTLNSAVLAGFVCLQSITDKRRDVYLVPNITNLLPYSLS